MLDHQNNYVGRSSVTKAVKDLDILMINLRVQYNYLNDPIKLFSDLYLAKFLDTSSKLFFFRISSN